MLCLFSNFHIVKNRIFRIIIPQNNPDAYDGVADPVDGLRQIIVGIAFVKLFRPEGHGYTCR